MQLFKNARVDFIRIRRRAIVLSVILIVSGLVSVAIHKGFNAGIDFAGGTLVEVQFTKGTAPLSKVRSLMEGAGFEGVEATNFGATNEVLIKIKSIGEAADAANAIEETLRSGFGEGAFEVRRVETVGPKIGSELRTAAFWAIIYSLAGIIVYISWRFEFRFAVAAILALIHDVLFTLGFFSVSDREISIPVIAAILTIVGYSLNDTIVVFDRIRENLRARKREGYNAVVNSSINETLSRTVVTSLTTLFVVLCLVVLGGPVIRDFALTLMVGIIAGTYSSIFIASPVLVEWEQWRAKRRKRR